MDTVNFTRMEDSTREEYEFLDTLEKQYCAGLADRLLNALRQLEHSLSGYKVTRLEHVLQGATRAHRAGESDEFVLAVLLHDIGDELAPHSHSEMAAAVLRPFVSEKIYWIVKHHGLFQMYYYANFFGGDQNARLTTSGAYGHRIGRSLAFAYLKPAIIAQGFEVTIDTSVGTRAAHIEMDAAYDAANDKLRS